MKCGFINCDNELTFTVDRPTKKFCCNGCRVKHYYLSHPKKKYYYDYRHKAGYYEKRRERRKKHYELHKDKEHDRVSKWIGEHREQYNKNICKSLAKARIEIRDSYARDQLKKWGIENPSNDQIKLYREQLKLKRKIYEKQRNTTNII